MFITAYFYMWNNKAKLLKPLIALVLLITLCTQSTFGQEEEFKLLEEKEIVHFGYLFDNGYANIWFLNLPQEVENRGLVIENLSRSCYGSASD